MSTQDVVKKAVTIVGGGTQLAIKLGVTPGAVTQWCLPSDNKFYRQIPVIRCPQIEQATGGQVRCEELRPDVAWEVLRCKPEMASTCPTPPQGA
jgi:DNA-binding transcriptional regulator YdaS (Cro superfamily)